MDIDPNEDRYPDATEAVSKVMEEEDFPEGPFERLEIRAQASGDITWRVWTPRAEEPTGGVILPA